MNLIVPAVILIVITAVAIAALLFVRRTAPDGGYFNDGDRAAGFFGVLATGFAVLLGFIVSLSSTAVAIAAKGMQRDALPLSLFSPRYEKSRPLRGGVSR